MKIMKFQLMLNTKIIKIMRINNNNKILINLLYAFWERFIIIMNYLLTYFTHLNVGIYKSIKLIFLFSFLF